MATQPEVLSLHIESMTNIIKIPTPNLEFSTYTSPKKISLGDLNND